MNNVEILEIDKRLKKLRKKLKAVGDLPHQVEFLEDINNTLKEVSLNLTQITVSIDKSIVENQTLLKTVQQQETNPWLEFRVSRAKVIEHVKMRLNDRGSGISISRYAKESLLVYETRNPDAGLEGISTMLSTPIAYIAFGNYIAAISHPTTDLFYKRVENGYVTLETGSLEKEELLNIVALFKERVDRLELPA